MMPKIALIVGVIILLLINLSIMNKEKLLAEGEIVYIDMAPLDPRSLMQGDYMVLRFPLASQVMAELDQTDGTDRELANGRFVVSLDKNRVATFQRVVPDIFENTQDLKENEAFLRYRLRKGQVRLGGHAFFFEEGTDGDYQKARYAQFRVAEDGEMILVDLYDESLNKIQPALKK